MPTPSHDGEVAVLDLGDTENRWHPDLLGSVDVLLGPVRAHDAIEITPNGQVRSALRGGEAVPV